jgi:hypothetical protein
VETGVRVEALLPRVRHRQSTLSLPFSLRFAVVKRPALLKRLERRLVWAAWCWQRRVARRLGVSGSLRGGAVVFTQWFGSTLQLTPHLHALLPEALWTTTGDVVELPAPASQGDQPTLPVCPRDGGPAEDPDEGTDRTIGSLIGERVAISTRTRPRPFRGVRASRAW